MIGFYVITAYMTKMAYNFERIDDCVPVMRESRVESHEDSATRFLGEIKAEKYTIDFRNEKIKILTEKLSQTNLKLLSRDIKNFEEYMNSFYDIYKSALRLYLKVIGAKTNGNKQSEIFAHFQKFLNEKFNSQYMVSRKKMAYDAYQRIMNCN